MLLWRVIYLSTGKYMESLLDWENTIFKLNGGKEDDD